MMIPLSRETSLYLDLWRLLAAVTVFLGHVSGQRLTGGFLWQFGPFTAEAVAIFFVLSGFVISYATDRSDHTASAYTVSRLARIYSVALPALLLTYLLDAVGSRLRPDLYSPAWGYDGSGQFWQFVAGLLFLNQIWGMHVTQGSDLPYWSLGYEVWYYVLFGLITFASGPWRPLSVLLVLIFVGPAIASMFPLWLLGLAGYRFCTTRCLSRSAGWLCYGGSLLAWAAYEAWGRAQLAAVVSVPAVFKRSMLIEDYVVGALFVAHVVGFQTISAAFRPVADYLHRPVRWAAGATFTIYLFHLPVAQFLATQVPWPPAATRTRVVLLGATLLILFVLAELTERRKDIWKRAFTLLLPPTRAASPTA
jgi:peptidoglycan/LPS O-acetylase OafA/YrhL